MSKEKRQPPMTARLLVCFIIGSVSFFAQNAHAESQHTTQPIPLPASVEVAFSPEGGATELVIKAITSAQHSIHVAAYSFTSRPIAKALVDAHNAGIDVDIVLDHDQRDPQSHSIAPYLAKQKIPMRIDAIHAIQHDKYMIIDDKTVETGSFNYTTSAEKFNSENVLVLWNAPKLAATYAQNWKSLWDQAEPYHGE